MLISKTKGKKLIAIILTLIMVISIFNLNTVISNAAEGKAADPSILTSVKLLHYTWINNEEVLTDKGDWSPWDSLRVEFEWAIPDGTVQEGDYLTITLPDELKLVDNMTIEMRDTNNQEDQSDATIVAVAKTDKAAKTVTITFTDYAKTHAGVSGNLWFACGFDKTDELSVKEVPITFAVEGSTAVTMDSGDIKFTPVGYDKESEPYLSKHGNIEENLENNNIYWDVRLHSNGLDLTGVPITLKDSLKERLTVAEDAEDRNYTPNNALFKEGFEVNVYRVYYYNDDNGWGGQRYSDEPVATLTEANGGLTITSDRKAFELTFTGQDNFEAESLSQLEVKDYDGNPVEVLGGGYWFVYFVDVEGGALPDVEYGNSAAVSFNDRQFVTEDPQMYSTGGGDAIGTKIDGSLEVSKAVTGDAAPSNDTDFTFVVKKDNNAVKNASYWIDDVEFHTNETTGYFTLKAGKTAIFKDLEKVSGYTVEEVNPIEPDDADLTTTNKVNTAVSTEALTSNSFAITNTGAVTVTFTNKYDPKETEPSTDPTEKETLEPSEETTLLDPTGSTGGSTDPTSPTGASTDPTSITGSTSESVETSEEDPKYDPSTGSSTDPQDESVETGSDDPKYDPSSTGDEGLDESDDSNKYESNKGDLNEDGTQTGDDSNMLLYAGLAALAVLVAAGAAIPALRRRTNK